MLVEVNHASGNGKVIRVGDVVEQCEDQAEYLIVMLVLAWYLSVVYANSYLISETSLLNDVHADVKDILHELFSTAGTGRHLLALGLLVLGRTEDDLSEHLHVSCLDCNTDHMSVGAHLVAGLEDVLDDSLETLLRCS